MAELEELLERLKAEQRDIIERAAQSKATPARSAIQRIGELELAIGAVEQLINETEGQ
ncbi:hypothetical protein GCM10019059_06240 [Camelimonas fluminis]|uniref:Uncharacterized protein n=1 Tax=Camelimonas fluminis TaxID=1576911 RepID=A0ABV7UGZ4_9HYPH|nr:hypothetical protein [Camelimonas fluminis]GHE49810.1 hypothetical protein GCM10019059_06240 [Camelimonas fluminis]